MGIVVNTVKDTVTGVVQMGKASGSLVSSTQIAKSASASFDMGSKTCPLISECRDFGHGIAQGDLSKTALNAGLLATYVVSLGAGAGNVKTVGMS